MLNVNINSEATQLRCVAARPYSSIFRVLLMIESLQTNYSFSGRSQIRSIPSRNDFSSTGEQQDRAMNLRSFRKNNISSKIYDSLPSIHSALASLFSGKVRKKLPSDIASISLPSRSHALHALRSLNLQQA